MKTYTESEVQDMMTRAWKSIVEFPYSQVCKHYAAIQVISAMPEELAPPKEIIQALFESDDKIALSYHVDMVLTGQQD